MSLYYEDIEIGARFTTASHVITEADIADFCRLTRDHHPLHTDAAYARQAGFDGIIAHGLYGLALMEGLKTGLKLYEDSSIASLGWNAVRFVRPMVAGDEVHVEMAFTDRRESRSRPAGVVTEAVDLILADGSPAITAEHVSLIRKRG
ncbi:MaoC family dehydratase N-terminal domain-containing protein [Rhodovulum sulfidophilum]|uniref:MaoC family dehydratase n=1 Tax=Rhodovulum sulfidophilum TaxID=35806 RepID=UPI0005A63EF0|nr:MaoC/PaaZ C-terminal domain-containing protein [Rhodovulum sulfidophilum]ANB33422.1 monoamine oxidase [Rhodovulum sulfidophilum DSM 1374]ANB37243.1 monoamine oxidase [Rhodovulum sulfidophilum]MBK5925580.1 monoamine oxidase [Rhodovulum sulfidophilum]MBL3562090.1 MaoC family dehydratase N-terminal domain-containing protein [Rhodovulum sulfidophilum]MBL3596162.1 MaoC family dehydratase N-terminal domain-containing protein [Rhodovulum sulfidophilum]